MTKRTVSNRRFSIKSFFTSFQKRKIYLASLEKAYLQKSLELDTLKRTLQVG